MRAYAAFVLFCTFAVTVYAIPNVTDLILAQGNFQTIVLFEFVRLRTHNEEKYITLICCRIPSAELFYRNFRWFPSQRY